MSWRMLRVLCSAMIVSCLISPAQAANQTDPLYEFKQRAARFHSVIGLPQFEITTNEIGESVRQTMAAGKAALDTIGALKPPKLTFENTVRALDDLGYQVSLTDNRLSLIKETSTNAALREAATDGIKELEEWSIGLEYREDVHRAVQGCAKVVHRLKGEDATLLAETLRDYRRAGGGVGKGERAPGEKMRQEMARRARDIT